MTNFFLRRNFFAILLPVLFLVISADEISEDTSRTRVLSFNEDFHNYDTSEAVNASTPRSQSPYRRMGGVQRLIVKDAPAGTGVPSWREIDLFGRGEPRKGRSFADARHSKSFNHSSDLCYNKILAIFSFLFIVLLHNNRSV